MADEPTTPAAPATETPPPAEPAVATPQTDPTPAQLESRSLIKQASADIDDLWSKIESRPAEQPSPDPAPADAETPPPAADGRQRDDKGRFTKAEAQPGEVAAPAEIAPTETVAEAPPPPADPAEVERRVRERIEAEQRQQEEARERIEAEQRFQREVGYYVGLPDDRQAVSAALEANDLGDTQLLDDLDVTLPNGKKVSEVARPDGSKGPGLTAAEARQVMIAWSNADRYGDALSDRKVQQVLGYWDRMTQAALDDPDVDASAVRAFRTPGEQIKAAIDTTRASVEKRLGEQHAAALAERDKTIAEQAQRINSLVNERGNLTSQQQAAEAASPDRPGQPGASRGAVPSLEALREMSADEFFKSGLDARILESIPGGLSPNQRPRRAG